MKTKRILHSIFSISIAIFFINAGYGKLTKKGLKPLEKDQVIEYIFEKNSYEAPVGYNITMNTFKQSGFLDLVSVFQIIAGLLIILPKTRLFGLLLLFPIIFNIFMMHVFFDNRIDENIETGFLFFSNVLLLLYYYKTIYHVICLKNVTMFRPLFK